MRPLRQNPRPLRRGRRRTVGRCRAGAAAVAAAAPRPGAATAPGASASTEYQAALKAVGSQGVHFVSTAEPSGVTSMSAATPAPPRASRRWW